MIERDELEATTEDRFNPTLELAKSLKEIMAQRGVPRRAEYNDKSLFYIESAQWHRAKGLLQWAALEYPDDFTEAAE